MIDANFLYHKQMIDSGLARCVLHVRGKPGFTYMKKEKAGPQIAWCVYGDERLPLHSLPHTEGDSRQAVGILLGRYRPKELEFVAPETRFADAGV